VGRAWRPCHSCCQTRLRCSRDRHLGIDVASGLPARRTRGRFESRKFQQEDLTKLSFTRGQFENVFSWGVIIHIPQLEEKPAGPIVHVLLHLIAAAAFFRELRHGVAGHEIGGDPIFPEDGWAAAIVPATGPGTCAAPCGHRPSRRARKQLCPSDSPDFGLFYGLGGRVNVG
jgi:hypothetical protein